MSEMPASACSTSTVSFENDHSVSLAKFLSTNMVELEPRMKGRSAGLATGFPELDELICGLHPGDLIVVGSRPAMGKTSFLLSVAEFMAKSGAIPVGFFSMESSGATLAWRFLAPKTRMSQKQFWKGGHDREHFADLAQALEVLGRLPIHIDDTPALSMEELADRARAMVKKHQLKVLFVDSLVCPSKGDFLELHEEMRQIVGDLKGLAQELGLPVVCSAPIRSVDYECLDEAALPRLKDLKIGDAARIADAVMLIHREAYYHKDDAEWLASNPEKQGRAQIIVDKNRRGPAAVVEMRWDAKGMRFWEEEER